MVTILMVLGIKIYKNFMEVEKRLPKDKYYGQWGLSHIFQNLFPMLIG